MMWSQLVRHHNPVPTGVRWAALKQMGIRTRVPTRICAKIGYWAMFVLWSSGIAAINLVMNLESLYLVLPPVRDLLVALGPSVESFVGAFLPPLAYTIFMAILPMVCATFSSLYGLPSVGDFRAPTAPQAFVLSADGIGACAKKAAADDAKSGESAATGLKPAITIAALAVVATMAFAM